MKHKIPIRCQWKKHVLFFLIQMHEPHLNFMDLWIQRLRTPDLVYTLHGGTNYLVFIHCSIPGILFKKFLSLSRLSTNTAIYAMSLYLLGKLEVAQKNLMLCQPISGISATQWDWGLKTHICHISLPHNISQLLSLTFKQRNNSVLRQFSFSVKTICVVCNMVSSH